MPGGCLQVAPEGTDPLPRPTAVRRREQFPYGFKACLRHAKARGPTVGPRAPALAHLRAPHRTPRGG